MKKVILKQFGSEIGHGIVEDDKSQEMIDIYLSNYIGQENEYTCEIIDVTDQVNQERINQESLKYLLDTDWYIVREYDAGIPCPLEIKQLRAEARSKIVK